MTNEVCPNLIADAAVYGHYADLLFKFRKLDAQLDPLTNKVRTFDNRNRVMIGDASAAYELADNKGMFCTVMHTFYLEQMQPGDIHSAASIGKNLADASTKAFLNGLHHFCDTQVRFFEAALVEVGRIVFGEDFAEGIKAEKEAHAKKVFEQIMLRSKEEREAIGKKEGEQKGPSQEEIEGYKRMNAIDERLAR